MTKKPNERAFGIVLFLAMWRIVCRSRLFLENLVVDILLSRKTFTTPEISSRNALGSAATRHPRGTLAYRWCHRRRPTILVLVSSASSSAAAIPPKLSAITPDVARNADT